MTTDIIIKSMDDAERAAKAMAASGFFPDSRQAAQAIVKILAGQELGFGPFASMTGVHIIQGKPVLAANLLASAIKRTGKYNYLVVEMTDTACEIAFFEGGQEIGRSRFDMENARQAGLTSKDNWKNYPRNMLFARALANGQRWYCPDIFSGATVYTPDEMGAAVDENEDIIDIPADPPQSSQGETPSNGHTRPYSPEILRGKLIQSAEAHDREGRKCTPGQQKMLAPNLENLLGSEEWRHKFLQWLFGVASLKALTEGQCLALHNWMAYRPGEDVSQPWIPDINAGLEAAAARSYISSSDTGNTL
jgi:hypothetical protein